MAKFVFRSLREITRADWLLNGTMFYDVGPIQYAFYSGPLSFGWKILEMILGKFKQN